MLFSEITFQKYHGQDRQDNQSHQHKTHNCVHALAAWRCLPAVSVCGRHKSTRVVREPNMSWSEAEQRRRMIHARLHPLSGSGCGPGVVTQGPTMLGYLGCPCSWPLSDRTLNSWILTGFTVFSSHWQKDIFVLFSSVSCLPCLESALTNIKLLLAVLPLSSVIIVLGIVNLS